MTIHGSRFSALVAIAACALCTSVSVAQSVAEKPASDVKLYELGDPTVRYDVVSRLWGDTWQSAFWVLPTFPTREDAIAALQTEAAKRGADGLVNVSCRDQGRAKWYSEPAPAFLCYGIAVRIRPS